MRDLLDDMQRAMADLLLSGYSSGESISHRLRNLGEECARRGLHTGAALMVSIAQSLENRAHTMQKEDFLLTAQICKAMRYVELCTEKLQETDIALRWEYITGGNP